LPYWVAAYLGLGTLIWLAAGFCMLRSWLVQKRLSEKSVLVPAPVWTWSVAPRETLKAMAEAGDADAVSLLHSQSQAKLAWRTLVGWLVLGFIALLFGFVLNARLT
tara:strand:+ start:87 stop:404 length:318 start_codon:yes stop_codon:yes gene_type:complete